MTLGICLQKSVGFLLCILIITERCSIEYVVDINASLTWDKEVSCRVLHSIFVCGT